MEACLLLYQRPWWDGRCGCGAFPEVPPHKLFAFFSFMWNFHPLVICPHQLHFPIRCYCRVACVISGLISAPGAVGVVWCRELCSVPGLSPGPSLEEAHLLPGPTAAPLKLPAFSLEGGTHQPLSSPKILSLLLWPPFCLCAPPLPQHLAGSRQLRVEKLSLSYPQGMELLVLICIYSLHFVCHLQVIFPFCINSFGYFSIV